MIPIPNHPDYFVDGSEIISMKFNKRRVLKQVNRGNGYIVVKLDYKLKYVHQLIAQAYLPNYSKNLVVNHIDFDTTNNDLSNLEMCTQAQNRQHNQSKCYYWNKQYGKWDVRIMVNDVRYFLGSYKSEADAICAASYGKLIAPINHHISEMISSLVCALP